MSEINENSETPARDSGVLLDARDASLVTLVAGDTQLAVHRSVLVAKSPVFAAMLAHDTVEASSGRIDIADVEPEVLHQLVQFMYKDCAPRLCSMVPRLLMAADKYCMPDLKAQCELQLFQDMSVENAMSSALVALRHSCPRLKESCGIFILSNFTEVMDTEGWADTVRKQPEEFLEVSRLLATKTSSECQEELDQKLLNAAENDRAKEVRELLATGACVVARDMRGRTALHCAAASGAEKATKCLLKAGALVEARDRGLQTPLHLAIQGNKVAVVQQLLKASSDVNAADVYGETPLHLAAQWGNTDVVEALLAAGANKEARNDHRETPLDIAERFEMEQLLAVLSVSDSDSESETDEKPETLACDFSALLKVKDATLVTLVAGETQLAVHRSVLMAKSPFLATKLARDKAEASDSRIVITDIEPKVLQQLLLFMYKDSAPELCNMAPQLLAAADKYCMPDLKAQCEMQLVRDLSVENVMMSALLALRHSCPHLQEVASSFLLSNFTKVVGTEGWAKTVRDNPEEFLEVSRLLVTDRCGSQEDTDQEDTDQDDMDQEFLKAAKQASFQSIKNLLAAGAYVGARDKNGRTALHYAAARGYDRNTDCLLQAGARVEVKDRWLQTPLHSAIQRNKLQVFRKLLAAAKDVNIAGMYGDTPLHLAAQWGSIDVVKALLAAGADKEARNDRRETPVDVAERFKRENLLAVLSDSNIRRNFSGITVGPDYIS